MDESRIPRREIGSDEEELLDRLWEQTAASEPSHSNTSDYADLQGRIRRRIRTRRIRTLVGSGMAAAAAVVMAVLIVGGPAPAPADAFEQLARMGVEIDRREVVMTTDDGRRMNLDAEARLERDSAGTLALNTESERIAVAEERRMKIEVPAGREFRLTLADGTEVWLSSMPDRRSNTRPRSKG